VTNDRAFALEVVRTLRQAGHEALWAGGCVRDEYLGLVPKDYDVATSARPLQVRRLFPHTVAVGAEFGVIEVIGPRIDHGHLVVQVATFRTDGEYTGGRWPTSVTFSSAREDALRRDFTINGLFFDPIEEQLIDHVGGVEDLNRRLLRAIGDPRARISEDKLRMLRGVRLAARFTLAIEPDTFAAILENASQIQVCSAERIADELRKMLVESHRAVAMRLFMDTGLAGVVMPELPPMRGLPQGAPREDGPSLPPPGRPGPSVVVGGGQVVDLWEHVLRVLDHLPEKVSFPLAFSALLHDVGKPRTVGRTPDRYTFHGHEHVGRRMTTDIALRLRLSNEERLRAEWLVEKHQVLADVEQTRPSKLKPLLVHPGVEELFLLHRADARASGRSEEHVDRAEQLRAEWSARGELDPPLPISGDDLRELGLTPGPLFKTLLEKVREAQLEGTLVTRDEALALVRRLVAERGKEGT
jgi:poly(A) polymerase